MMETMIPPQVGMRLRTLQKKKKSERPKKREAERRPVTDEPQDVRLRELRVLVIDDAEVEGCGTEIDRLERRQLHERADEPAA